MPDLYGYEEKLNRKLKSIEESKEISPHNKKKILDFQKHCIANGIGPARVLRYLNDLPKLAKMLNKNFEDVTKNDIETVLCTIEKTDYAPRTKLDFKVTLKKFYKWINGGEEYPKCIKWIKTGDKLNNNKLPDELLTEEEVKKMISHCRYSRDRALISICWESGCRVGELLTMQIKNVAFEDTITRIVVQGKTGMRRIPLIDSTPYLAEWIENHPFKDKPNVPLWVGIGNIGRNKPLDYAAFRKMLKVVAEKAGIKKKVNPHNFRHSRATLLSKNITEAQMNQYFGWVQGSDIPATYVHLSGRDVDDAILKLRGLKPSDEEKTKETLAPKKCSRCGFINKATGKFCTRCGVVLDLQTALTLQDEMKKMDEKFSKLLQNKGVQKFLIKKMLQLGIE